MKSFIHGLISTIIAAWVIPAASTVNVFATVPEWGGPAEEWEEDEARVFTAPIP